MPFVKKTKQWLRPMAERRKAAELLSAKAKAKDKNSTFNYY
jgi:hypothetical protein